MPRGRPPLEPKAEHCVAPGCTDAILSRNLCSKHYIKSRRPPRCPKSIRHTWTLTGRCKACGVVRQT